MTLHFERELEKLKQALLSLSARAEEGLRDAMKAAVGRDTVLADQMRRRAAIIDEKEVELEEECLKLLALHQPVAFDLRFVVAVLKINNDLERVGDLAESIADRTEIFAADEKFAVPPQLEEMALRTKLMLKSSIDSLIEHDCKLALKVLSDDDEVDLLHKQVYSWVVEHLDDRKEPAKTLIGVLSVSRNLERISDLATNIAEDVIYMLKGEIVRHKGSDN